MLIFFFLSVSQIGTLEALIGLKLEILRHWLVRARCIPITCLHTCSVGINGKHEITLLASQVGLFHLTLTQIISEMKCIAKNKCPDSQKLDTTRHETQRWELQQVSRTKTCISFLHSFSLIYFMWCKKIFRKSYLHSETKSVECLHSSHNLFLCVVLSSACVYIETRIRLGIHTKTRR